MIIVTGTVNFESLDKVGQVKQALIKRAQLLQAHLEAVNKEFTTLLGTAKVTRAIVVSNEAGADRILM